MKIFYSGNIPGMKVRLSPGAWLLYSGVLLICLMSISLCGCVDAHRKEGPPAVLSESPRDSELFTDRDYIEHVQFLAADIMEGRGVGTSGLDKAAGYIAGIMKASGLSPAGTDGYFQRFTAKPRGRKVLHDGTKPAFETNEQDQRKISLSNIIGMVSAPEKTSRSVIIGAHYDHLGFKVEADTDGNISQVVFNGADDNASGVAGLLLLAEAFVSLSDRLSSNIYFVAFSGEESGLLGSAHFVQNLPCRADSIISMINLDMIGRLRDGRLIIASAGSGEGLQEIFEQAASGLDISPVFDRSGSYSGSDSDSFIFAGIPAVHLFTDVHPEYNTPADDTELVNGPGGALVTRFTFRVVEHLASLKDHPRFAAEALKGREPTHSSGRKVYTGVIPMFGGEQVEGVAIRGAVPGSPASLAGLKPGDIIIGIGGKSISSLAEYAGALALYNPGSKAEIAFKRDGIPLTVEVTLAQRPD